MWALAALTLASWVVPMNWGTMVAARMPRMTTTTMISIRVKAPAVATGLGSEVGAWAWVWAREVHGGMGLNEPGFGEVRTGAVSGWRDSS
jgi:hypothetical protein